MYKIEVVPNLTTTRSMAIQTYHGAGYSDIYEQSLYLHSLQHPHGHMITIQVISACLAVMTCRVL